MKSLRARLLTGALILMTVLVSATLLLSRQVAVSEVNDILQRGRSREVAAIVREVQQAVDRSGSLDSVDSVLNGVAARTGAVLILMDADRKVVATAPPDLDRVDVGATPDGIEVRLASDGMATELVFAGALPTLTDRSGQTLASLIVAPAGGYGPPPVVDARLDRRLLVVALVVGVSGVLLSALATRGLMRPIERQQEAVRRTLLNDVAHELRTPLAHVRAEIEAVQDGLRPLTPAVIERLHADALHLERLVDDLRDLADAEGGQLRLAIESVDVAALVDTVATAIDAAASARGVHVERDIAPGAAVRADPSRLRQVLDNLLDNALRHTPDGGVITVRARRTGANVTISVVNDGEGVPAADLPHLFDRLYRVDPSRDRRTGGTGLGLAIVRQLVALQHGTVVAENAPPRGLEVWLTLPAA